MLRDVGLRRAVVIDWSAAPGAGVTLGVPCGPWRRTRPLGSTAAMHILKERRAAPTA